MGTATADLSARTSCIPITQHIFALRGIPQCQGAAAPRGAKQRLDSAQRPYRCRLDPPAARTMVDAFDLPINVFALMFSVITSLSSLRMIDGFLRASNRHWRSSISVGGGDNFVHIENLDPKLRPIQTPLRSLKMWLSAEIKPTPPWFLRTLENLECFSVH